MAMLRRAANIGIPDAHVSRISLQALATTTGAMAHALEMLLVVVEWSPLKTPMRRPFFMSEERTRRVCSPREETASNGVSL